VVKKAARGVAWVDWREIMLDRYLIPLAPYVLIALNAVLCLIFFLCLESEMRSLKSMPRHTSAGDIRAAQFKAKLDDLSARVRDAEERVGIQAVPLPPKSCLNWNKRTQVLRMSRRGEPAENIAAMLSMPRQEVELLLKVNGLILRRSSQLTA
jgi:hypothetical protein